MTSESHPAVTWKQVRRRFPLNEDGNLRTLRAMMRRAAEAAMIGTKFEGLFLVHVAGGISYFRGGELTVSFTERDFEGIPHTLERNEWMIRVDSIEKRYGLFGSVVGSGVLGSDGQLLGWIVGLDLEKSELVVVEENTEERDWVGVPILEIADKVKRFGIISAQNRPGGRIA